MELEAKQRQDAEAEEWEALDQRDPGINRNLFNLNSDPLDDSPEPTDCPPASHKQRNTRGTAIARHVSPTKQAPPTNPSKHAAPANLPPSTQPPTPKHNHCFKQIILELSVMLKTDKSFSELSNRSLSLWLTQK